MIYCRFGFVDIFIFKKDMKMIKKNFIFLLTVIMLFVLSGCGTGSQGENKMILDEKISLNDTIVTKSNKTSQSDQPIIKAQADALDILDGDFVHIWDDGSYDPQGSIVKYEWRDMDNNLIGTNEVLKKRLYYNSRYDFKNNGTTRYVKTLTITNDRGITASKSFTIIVHKRFYDDNLTTNSTIKGSVKDLSNNSALLSGVNITLYVDNRFVKNILSDENGTYIFENIKGDEVYRLVAKKSGYEDLEYDNIELKLNELLNLETLYMQKIQDNSLVSVSGKVIDAVNGRGINASIMNLRKGINVRSGAIITNLVSEIDGDYLIENLRPGSYTLEIIADGYISGYFTIVLNEGEKISNQDHALTPLLDDGIVRVILTWGEHPMDLDSHLTGPQKDFDNRFHVYFSNIQVGKNKLDLDDKRSYGPETITIKDQIDGIYRYYVHNYTDRTSSNSTTLANSNAKIKVYKGSILEAEFNVPNEPGVVWNVFEVENGEIKPINTIEYKSHRDLL